MTDDTIDLVSYTSPKARSESMMNDDQHSYMCLTWDVRVTIIHDEGYWTLRIELKVVMVYRCSKFDRYCLLSWPDNSKLICSSAESLWPYIKVKVIETTTSIMKIISHAYTTFVPSLNAIYVKYCPSWDNYYSFSSSLFFILPSTVDWLINWLL